MECIFCRIISGEIPADIVYQDKELIAFRDIHPQAPTHILIIPKSHIASMTDLTSKHEALMGRLILLAREFAEKESISASGYRLSVSAGADGGQIVPHLHFHLLGGRKLDDMLG
ncbi:MAG: histidine triad nucleotide-binding protein [Chloroflexi bacterium RBG_19FT_COMBO_48_23]|nr:MAG: histidine triad nucleotide-binding protein [Chloroflexi bacterium RBG_19FT_COMBO_48_23]